MVVVMGVLNCNVALSGASLRENPLLEKSFQLSVARFAARAYNIRVDMLERSSDTSE
jgi:hypothetical protein